MTRTTKTPKQRAEEALAVAERRVERLKARELAAQIAHTEAVGQVDEAVKRRDYLAADPALRDEAGSKSGNETVTTTKRRPPPPQNDGELPTGNRTVSDETEARSATKPAAVSDAPEEP